jgi:nucleoside triphosphatase
MTIAGAHVVFHRCLKSSSEGATSECHVPAVLLCKRTQDAPIHPGFWGLLGGNVQNGESAEQTVRREVSEELQVGQGANLDEVWRGLTELADVSVRRGEDTCVIKYYSCLFNCDMDQLTLRRNSKQKVEGEGLAWFSANEIHCVKVRPEDRIAVSYFLKEIAASSQWTRGVENGQG